MSDDHWASLNSTGKIEYLYSLQQQNQKDLDNVVFLLLGFNIYLMQWGFALLESGSVRSKSTTNILIKNLIDNFVGAICFYFTGFAFAFGDGNAFIGYSEFFLTDGGMYRSPFFFFQLTFIITSVTIVSGSMAERTDLRAYFLFATLFTSFTYPVVAHWAWSSQGWLKQNGYHDLAGSSVVHCTGGMAGLVGTVLLGRRELVDYGRMRGHSTVLCALGFFFLSFGFLSFNAGSLYRASGGNSLELGNVVVNTVCSGSAAGLSALLTKKISTSKMSLVATINGSLAGFVAICSSADVVTPYGALIIGAVAGVVFVAFSHCLFILEIDDPLDASPVHLGAGLWGVMGCGLFSKYEGLFYTGNLYLLGINSVGAILVSLWSGFWTFLLFYGLKRRRLLRISEKAELEGLDLYKHNESAYPEIVQIADRLTELSEEIDTLRGKQS